MDLNSSCCLSDYTRRAGTREDPFRTSRSEAVASAQKETLSRSDSNSGQLLVFISALLEPVDYLRCHVGQHGGYLRGGHRQIYDIVYLFSRLRHFLLPLLSPLSPPLSRFRHLPRRRPSNKLTRYCFTSKTKQQQYHHHPPTSPLDTPTTTSHHPHPPCVSHPSSSHSSPSSPQPQQRAKSSTSIPPTLIRTWGMVNRLWSSSLRLG